MYCNNIPTLHNMLAIKLEFCRNCIIQGIKWYGCGYEKKPALKLNNSFNTAIKNCCFQHSKGQAIVLSNLSGDVITLTLTAQSFTIIRVYLFICPLNYQLFTSMEKFCLRKM